MCRVCMLFMFTLSRDAFFERIAHVARDVGGPSVESYTHNESVFQVCVPTYKYMYFLHVKTRHFVIVVTSSQVVISRRFLHAKLTNKHTRHAI